MLCRIISHHEPTMMNSTPDHAPGPVDRLHSQTGKGKQEKKPEGASRTKKTVYHWGNAEVLRWLRKYHVQYHSLYSQVFQEHDLSGRALVRLNPIRMEKMGITDPDHRADLLEHILRLRLKHEQNELKILQNSQQGSS